MSLLPNTRENTRNCTCCCLDLECTPKTRASQALLPAWPLGGVGNCVRPGRVGGPWPQLCPLNRDCDSSVSLPSWSRDKWFTLDAPPPWCAAGDRLRAGANISKTVWDQNRAPVLYYIHSFSFNFLLLFVTEVNYSGWLWDVKQCMKSCINYNVATM